MAFEKEYKEFIMIGVNLNTIRNDGKKYLYDKDDPYLEFNNVKHHNIIWLSCIDNYYIFYLKFKTTNNSFSKAIFKSIKKIYTKEETRH